MDDILDTPLFLQIRAAAIWQRALQKALSVHGISYAQFVTMAVLADGAAKSQKSIATESVLDKMVVSQTVRQLAGKRLVQAIKDPEDARSTLVSLTKEGRHLYSDGLLDVRRISDQLAGVLQNEEEYYEFVLKQLIFE